MNEPPTATAIFTVVLANIPFKLSNRLLSVPPVAVGEFDGVFVVVMICVRVFEIEVELLNDVERTNKGEVNVVWEISLEEEEMDCETVEVASDESEGDGDKVKEDGTREEENERGFKKEEDGRISCVLQGNRGI